MTIMPAVNQVEFNPFTQQKELRKVMDEHQIRLEAWYPLGHGNKDLLENEIISRLAQKYHKNAGRSFCAGFIRKELFHCRNQRIQNA